ncbi:MAG: hypothetical protein JW795_12555 [Chitinivibrionales bacterium]|nr:hypothetical protein [Chitinivibrionales bacterium]
MTSGGSELPELIIFPPPPSRVFANLRLKARLINNLAGVAASDNSVLCRMSKLLLGSV